MVLTAIAIATNLDVNFDQFVAQKHPRRQPHGALECSRRSPTACTRSPATTPSSCPPTAPRACGGSARPSRGRGRRQPGTLLAAAHALPTSGRRPNSPKPQDWFNTPGRRPLTLGSLRGRVVLVDFWTYTCINCIRTLPYLKAWDAAYRRDGLTIVGVETPEFAFEHDAGNVAQRDPASSASATRSSRTTRWAPGTPTATSTGRPTT